MRPAITAAALLLATGLAACTADSNVKPSPQATWGDVQALPAASTGQRIPYGPDAKQFGDLRLPTGSGPHPVAVLLHGGCWQSEYDLQYFAHLADQLALQGIATWNLEYRRIGDPGGAWPGTFDDVAIGAAHLRTLAKSHPLDLDRVVLVGHSAGGQLALWLGKRSVGGASAPMLSDLAAAPVPVRIRGVVTLAGIADLREYANGAGSCNQSVVPLLGGTADQVPERYAATSPSELIPVGVPMRLLIGAQDSIVPPGSNRRFAALARSRGDDVDVVVIEGAGHFDLVMPTGPAAERVQRAIRELLRAD